MNIREISEEYNLDEFEFQNYIRLHGLQFNFGLFSGMTIDDDKVENYVDEFRASTSPEEVERRLEEKRRQKEEAERQYQLERERMRRATAGMLITSGFTFDGYRITKYSGYISGDDAMTVNRGIDFLGFATSNTKDGLLASLSGIRRNALQELKEAAYNLGCNAVIGVDFDYITLDPQTANLAGGTTYQPYVFCVTANGNAVVIEKIEE